MRERFAVMQKTAMPAAVFTALERQRTRVVSRKFRFKARQNRLKRRSFPLKFFTFRFKLCLVRL